MSPRAALLALVLIAVPTHGDGESANGASLHRGPRLDPIGDAPARVENLDALFQKHGATQGVDWRLLKAIAITESHLNPRAVNRRDPSIGLMGVLCRPQGETCGNRLDVAGWPPARREQLFGPDYNVAIGAQVLAWNVRTFGLRRGVACYNAWSACRDGQKEPFSNRPFPNQFYVDQVLARYRALQSAIGAPLHRGPRLDPIGEAEAAR